jgi:tol-pal system protein YbgF
MHDIRQTVVTAMIQSSCIRSLRALAVGALLAFGMAPAMAPAAFAQSDLSAEVRRLRDDLTALQRQVYRGGTPPATVPGGGGGEISGEIAIRLSDRIAQLESQIQQLTGRTEEIDFRTAQMQRRLDKLVEDIDFRLSSLEKAGQAPASAPPANAPPAQQGAVPPPPAPAVSPPSAAPPAAITPPAAASRTSDPNTPARPEGVLGTLRTGPGGQVTGATQAPGAATPTPPPAAPPAAPPRTASKLQGNNPTEQYNYAFRLLNQGDYGDAEQAFTEFIKQNPGDPLAGNAQYWLAETFYVRKEYEKAAAGFLAGYQKYPKSSKAPDSLVKLGKTLNDLNQKQEACAVFVQFNKDFPNAPTALKAVANTERQRGSCK